MSTQWNSRYTNIHLGSEHFRPSLSSPVMFACRICDKIFFNSHALIEHYESHGNELAQRTRNHQPTPYISSLRERGEINLTNNGFQPRLTPTSTLQQRYHPYFPNGYRPLQRQSALSNPFLASSQTQNLLQPRHPVGVPSTLGGSLSIPNLTSGRDVADSRQFVIRQQLSSTQQVSPTQRVPLPKTREQKGRDEPAKKGTVWYLSQLEHPIPKMIDLESENYKREYLKLDLTLKL